MRPNIILITIDSLRADHVSSYGYERQTTPNIDKLVNQSIVYENAYANGPNTPNSFPSILFSRYICESSSFKLPKHWKSIASILKMEGYSTIGFNSGNSWLTKFFNYGNDFDKYESYLDQSFEWDDKRLLNVLRGNKYIKHYKNNKSKIIKIILRITKFIEDIIISDFTKKKSKIDKKFSDEVTKYSSNLKPPFFMWIHFMDVHYPYVPEKRFHKFGKSSWMYHLRLRFLNYFVRFNLNCNRNMIQNIKNIYDNAIIQTDHKIGRILDLLKKNKMFNNSMIIITSDHGECFKEHGNFYHYTKNMYNELLKVPLIIKFPYQTSSTKIKSNVSLISILPTIIETLNIDSNIFMRRKTLPKNNKVKNEIIFSEGYNMVGLDDLISPTIKLKPRAYTIINDNWKLLIDFQKNRNQLFDLSKDNMEKSNLIKNNKIILMKLTDLLDKHIVQEKNTLKIEKRISDKINKCSGKKI